MVRARIEQAHPGLAIEVVVIETLGDLDRERPLAALGAQGIFTQGLERALDDDRIDVAVHSAKDLPSHLSPVFVLAASPAREDARDCLVTAASYTVETLPQGARIGTGSPRRAAQLRALRPDLKVSPVRGNVDTRRHAALDGRLDGVILAAAGLKRLGLLDRHAYPLSVDQCLPQAGQGIVGLEVRASDTWMRTLLGAVDDTAAGTCLEAERAVLAVLAAGCQAPAAAYATLAAARLVVRGMVSNRAGTRILRASAEGSPGAAAAIGREVAERLVAQGARDLLAGAAEDSG
jgi:hydroxymethylbilane synthase